MSLAYIRRLMQEDDSLRLPAIAAWAAASRRVVSLIAMDAYGGRVVNMAMLHINTQGKIQWSMDRIGTPSAPTAVWCKEHRVGPDEWKTKPTWTKGWAQAVRHISNEHIVVFFSVDDVTLLQNQFTLDGQVPPSVPFQLVLKETYRKNHPHRNSTLLDMVKFYQTPLDPERPIKAMVLTYAKLLEKMLSEGIPALGAPPSTSEETPVDDSLDTVRKYTLKTAANAESATAFFDAVARVYPLNIAHNHKKILGFSIRAEGAWHKGSDLHRTLAWPALVQEKRWALTSDDVARLDFLYNDETN